MNKSKIMGATLAAAAALAFSVLPVTSAMAAGTDNNVPCYGANACKGKGACKTAKNACKGQNSCKGMGMMMKSSAEECKTAGGTTKES